MNLSGLRQLMLLPTEQPTVEFKEAKRSFSADEALEYLCAIANRGGGHLVLGVTNTRPRRIVGTRAFETIHEHIRNWQTNLGAHIEIHEIYDEDGERVLVFELPSRPPRQYLTYKGVPCDRNGDSIGQMSPKRMQLIALETTDYSALPAVGLKLSELDQDALEAFHLGVVDKKREADQERYRRMTSEALLDATGLLRSDGSLTNAALLLLGREGAIRERMGWAEILFEYRINPNSIRHSERDAVRRPLILGLEALWRTIQPLARAHPIEVHTGTRVFQLPRYAERSVREALLNAAAHRDYTKKRSVEVFMSPEAFVVSSPGPFPLGVTPQNVANSREWRNQILAEAMESCGLIERSGQGVNLMMASAVYQAQPLPVFDEPEADAVVVTLHGSHDPSFLRFTQQIPLSDWEDMPVEYLETVDGMRRRLRTSELKMDAVQRMIGDRLAERSTDGHLRPHARFLSRLPLTERRRFGAEGLKDQLVETIGRNEPAGLSLGELLDLFPDVPRSRMTSLLNGLRGNRVELQGERRWARWHIAASPTDGAPASSGDDGGFTL